MFIIPASHSIFEQGRLLQVEYAQQAARNGGTVFAVKGKDAVVLFSLSSSLSDELIESQNREIGDDSSGPSVKTSSWKNWRGKRPDKLQKIRSDLYVIGSGISADVSHTIRYAFTKAMHYRTEFGSDIPVRRLVNAVGKSFHDRTLYPGLRPFGCSLLFIAKNRHMKNSTKERLPTMDNNASPLLCEIDSFGNVFDCDISCIGRYGEDIISSWCKDESPLTMTKDEIISRGKQCITKAIHKASFANCDDDENSPTTTPSLTTAEMIAKGIDVVVIDFQSEEIKKGNINIASDSQCENSNVGCGDNKTITSKS